MPNQFGYRAALHNYLNRAGHMFSSNIDKTNFETSLKNYNAKNTVNINIELTDNDLSVLRTENAQITKGSHIIQNQDGKLNIYRAGSLNVSVEDALNFHKEAIYSVSSSLRAGRHGGQTPGVIIASSSSEDFTFSIFSGGIAHRSSDNKYEGAAFGPAINVRKDEHISHTADFISIFYMLNHLNEHKEPMVPYVLFSSAYGNGKNGVSESEVIRLGQDRRAKFITAAINARHTIDESPGKTPILKSFGKNKADVLLPLVFHDLLECKYYVIEGDRKITFSDWVDENGLSDKSVVRAHLKNIKLHESESEYFVNLVDLMRWRKVLGCVDSRFNRENTGVIRDLGAIASKEQRARIIETPGLKSIPVDLHFECGYLTTAINIHEVGRALKGIFEKNISTESLVDMKMARRHFELQLRDIFRGNDVSYNDHQENFFKPLIRLNENKPLPKGVQDFLDLLLVSDISDTRNTVAHLYQRGLLRWHVVDNTLSMPIASKFDSELAQNGSDLLFENRSQDPSIAKEQKKQYCRAVTLKVAEIQQKSWEKTAKELGKGDIKIKVRIEDFEDGKVYYTSNGSDMYDAITNQKI